MEAAPRARGPAGFEPAQRFLGARPGFVFGKGPQGLGYYVDEAGKAAARQADKKQDARDGVRQEEPERKRPRREALHATAEARRLVEQTEVEDAALDEQQAFALCKTLAKRLEANLQQRAKFEDSPAKFLESELEVHQQIQQVKALASAPLLYGHAKRAKLAETLVGLLCHLNEDIVKDSLELLSELLESDTLAEAPETALELFDDMVKTQLVETIVEQLTRFDETTDTGAAAVYHALDVLENMFEVRSSLCESALTGTSLVPFLLERVQRPSFDSNKLHASELLSVVFADSEANQRKFRTLTMPASRANVSEKRSSFMEVLLAAALAGANTDPETLEQEECVANLFLTLCSVLMAEENRAHFVELGACAELLRIVKKRRFAYPHAVNVLGHALDDSKQAAEQLISQDGLRVLFPLLMGRSVGVKSSSRKRKRSSKRNREVEEQVTGFVLTILFSLFINLEPTSIPYRRLLRKFFEQDFEKVDRLVELYHEFARKIDRISGDDLDDANLYLARMDAGLEFFQYIQVALAHLVRTADPGLIAHLRKALYQRKHSLTELSDGLLSFVQDLNTTNVDDDGAPGEISQAQIQLAAHLVSLADLPALQPSAPGDRGADSKALQEPEEGRGAAAGAALVPGGGGKDHGEATATMLHEDVALAQSAPRQKSRERQDAERDGGDDGEGDDEDFDAFLERVMEESGLDKKAANGTAAADIQRLNEEEDIDLEILLAMDGPTEPPAVIASSVEQKFPDDKMKVPSKGATDDFLAWLVSDDQARGGSKIQKRKDSALSEHEREESGLPEEVLDLMTSLSAELELTRDRSNVRRVVKLCRRIGLLPWRVRAQVWHYLLESTSGVARVARQTNSPPKEDSEFIRAMAQSAILRHQALMDEAGQEPNEDQPVLDKVFMGLRITLASFGIDESLCDPAIADVVFLLSNALLRVNTESLSSVVRALQQRRILLLQLPNEDPEVPLVLRHRAKLLDLAMPTHDRDLFDHVFKGNAAQVILPWRWWRCAFAGEMPPAALCAIWDQLIIDSCPENSGDDGPSSPSQVSGVFEGCDPRGPLVVYVVLALLICCRDELLALPHERVAQTALDVLRCKAASLAPKDAHALCEHASTLRASTPLQVVQHAFLEDKDPHASTKGAAAHSQQDARANPKHRGNWLTDRVKLTLGIGGTSAKTLERERQIRQGFSEEQRKAMQEHLQFRDFELQPPTGDDEDSDSELDVLEARLLKHGEATASDSVVVDLPEQRPKDTAFTLHALGGLQPGQAFDFSVFSLLKDSDWHCFPVHDGEGKVALLVFVSMRMFVVTSTWDLKTTLTGKKKAKLSKNDLLQALVVTPLVVVCNHHLLELRTVTFARLPASLTGPSHAHRRKLTISFHHASHPALRLALQHRYVNTVSRIVQADLAALF
ncbi:Beta-catenin-like protein 1 (Nuclear-associated protein) (NAP) [Durusdinium trenchii]|uniref:Beta-catenin-like protein 1 (Nuclear-associated protein) (NAP) n=1 Tax=Durusdinium trenchii TaxID=1381693 RepID=A0ABP0QQX9_9DINO